MSETTGRTDRDRHRTGCYAPSLQVVLLPNGNVGPCCRNDRAYGNIQDRLLSEIWRDRPRQRLIDQLEQYDFSSGCEECGVEASLMDRSLGYPSQFDYWAEQLGAGLGDEWPVRIEFDLSNTCNLQCIQCHGELSSSIRIHREKRAPLAKGYGDAFFEDLRQFIPHLRSAGFAGGEPFLAQESFRVWDLCAELAPGLDCTIVTNGTQWNRRVEAVLDQLHVQPVISMDGLTKATYEQIRIGSDHDTVMRNIDRFCAYADRVGSQVNINFCLMPQNIHELPDLLRFAEDRGIFVNVLTVLSPAACSLPHMRRDDLASVADMLERRAQEMELLTTNRKTWLTAMDRIRSWLSSAVDDDHSEWVNRTPAILQFPRHGKGPIDGSAARAELALFASDGRIHQVRVGTSQVGRGWSRELAEGLGFDRDALEGRPLSALLDVSGRSTVVEDHDDRCETHFELEGREVRAIAVPIRDDGGWADQVHIYFAIRSTT